MYFCFFNPKTETVAWDSGTVLIQAKATIDGVYEFKVINEKVVD